MSNDTMNGALSWDSQIEQESEFVVLPAGKYNFVVESMERGHFGGSEKMSACPMAVLTLSDCRSSLSRSARKRRASR